MAALSKPTLGSNADYAARIGLLFDAFNNGNYQFPATQVASADPNTLDDYEEGTWTPSLGGTATYTVQTGRYTKVGRFVHISAQVTVNSIGSGSTGTISGLPFTAGGVAAIAVGYWASSATNYTSVAAYIQAAATTVRVTAIAAAGASVSDTAAFFGNSAAIVIGGNYSV